MPRWVENHICCEHTLNLDQFALPNIYCFRDLPEWRWISQAALRRLKLRRQLSFIAAAAKHSGASIVHSHFGSTGWRNVEIVRRLRLRHVVTFYGVDAGRLPTIHRRWRSRYRKMFETVDAVLCEGPYFARTVVALGCPEWKVRVHHLGVRLGDIGFQPRIWDGSSTLRVLLCATFVEKKGLTHALAALARVPGHVDLEITIIGDARPEPRSLAEKRTILAVISRHGLSSRVRLLGYQPHNVMLEEAYKHHIFLSPSVTASDGDSEGGAPVTVIELAASGMPVVSTRHCDIPEVIEHGKSGLLAAEGDVAEIASHLTWLIDNPGAWRAMTSAARKRIEREFDAQVQGERLAAIYHELAGLTREPRTNAANWDHV